jgi:uncharacterized protein
LKLILFSGFVIYLGVVGAVWLMQDRLMFYPRPAGPTPPAPPGWRLEEVAFTTRDGTPLSGVLVRPAVDKPGVVLYYGGNAEEVTEFVSGVPQTYGERAVLLVNYRGYGASGGSPSEASLVSDALELFDWAAARKDLDPARIAVHGRSLGSGVAVQVAAAKPVRCVVLTSPFTSALDVAKEIYPWLPVSMLMRHVFDSGAHAPKLRMPALILMGDADTLIPKKHSERLAGLWGATVEQESFAGFGHNDLDMNPRYHVAIRNFLDRCL